MTGTLENKFNGINMRERKIPDDIHVTIRKSRNPLHLGAPLAVVDCGCGTQYKKRLFYQRAHYFSNSETLHCPGPGCDNEVSLSYSKSF